MSQDKAFEIIESMYDALPWLYDCTQRMDLTEIGRIYDVHELIVAERQKKEGNDAPGGKPPSLESRIKPAKEVSDSLGSHCDKPPNHDDPNL